MPKNYSATLPAVICAGTFHTWRNRLCADMLTEVKRADSRHSPAFLTNTARLGDPSNSAIAVLSSLSTRRSVLFTAEESAVGGMIGTPLCRVRQKPRVGPPASNDIAPERSAAMFEGIVGRTTTLPVWVRLARRSSGAGRDRQQSGQLATIGRFLPEPWPSASLGESNERSKSGVERGRLHVSIDTKPRRDGRETMQAGIKPARW